MRFSSCQSPAVQVELLSSDPDRLSHVPASCRLVRLVGQHAACRSFCLRSVPCRAACSHHHAWLNDPGLAKRDSDAVGHRLLDFEVCAFRWAARSSTEMFLPSDGWYPSRLQSGSNSCALTYLSVLPQSQGTPSLHLASNDKQLVKTTKLI